MNLFKAKMTAYKELLLLFFIKYIYISDRVVALNMVAKKTFLNLKPERQEEILKTALIEFTRNDYKSASLTSIVKSLKLAKGSFYRYFNSKKELYIFLIDFAGRKRYEDIDELVNNIPETIEDLLIENFRKKIEFDKQYPLYSGFLYRVMLDWNTDELGDLQITMKNQILEKTTNILEIFKEKGKLSHHYDISAMAFSILNIQIGIYEYLTLKYKTNFLKNVVEGKPVFNLKDEEVMHVVQSFAGILSNGINA